MNEELVSRLRFMKKMLGVMGIALVAVVCLCVIVYFMFGTEPKTPVTPEQMWDVLVARGYEPQDITESYIEDNPDAKAYLNRFFVLDKDDLHFEFYDLNDEDRAFSIYSNVYNYIYTQKRSVPYAQHDTSVQNYAIYTLKSSGEYSVVIWVENTAIYAYCDEENSYLISEILTDIGYFS